MNTARGAALLAALALAACGDNLDDTIEAPAVESETAPPAKPDRAEVIERMAKRAEFLTGAEQAAAYYRLGTFHEEGRGIPKDVPVAVQYYRQAASLGSEEARAALERLGEN